MPRPGFATGLAGLIACAAPAAASVLSALLLIPADLPPPPSPDENPPTEEKRTLGKILFWDEQLSSDNTVSCGTCHMPEASGADFRNLRNAGFDNVLGTEDDGFGSPGVLRADPDGTYRPDPIFGSNPQVTARIAPPVIMAAYFTELFWDGRASAQFINPQTGGVSLDWFGALESQAVGPPLSSVEMAHPGREWDHIGAKLARVQPLALASDIPPDMAALIDANPTYPDLFARAFGDPAITAERIAWAIGTYERSLIPDQTPWDRFQAGETDALTPDQVRGMNAFDVAFCNFCHTQPIFTDDLFANIGLRPVREDKGRQNVTGSPLDGGRFKTPSLRNVGLRTAFMHNGMFNNLTDVVRFYGQFPGSPAMSEDNLDPAIPLVTVIEDEVPFMVDFMANALTDPRVQQALPPFDRPTLFANRAGGNIFIDSATGVPGAALPRMVANDPPLIGNQEFRVGLFDARPGAQAWIGFSHTAPQGATITPEYALAEQTLPPEGNATLHFAILPDDAADGEVLYMQWFIADPDAPNGLAASAAVRLTFFCSPFGCPLACDPDVNCDGVPDQDDVACMILAVAGDMSCFCQNDPDFNKDGVPDQGDVADVIMTVAGAPCP